MMNCIYSAIYCINPKLKLYGNKAVPEVVILKKYAIQKLYIAALYTHPGFKRAPISGKVTSKAGVPHDIKRVRSMAYLPVDMAIKINVQDNTNIYINLGSIYHLSCPDNSSTVRQIIKYKI